MAKFVDRGKPKVSERWSIWAEMDTGDQRRAAGQRLASLRGGKSQAVFGPELGVTKTTLGAYERGERSPDLDFLLRLKELTGVSLDWLATGAGHPKSPELVVIDTSALMGIIAAIEDETPKIDPDSKARLIVRLYADRMSTKEGTPAEVERSSRGAA